MKPKLRTQTEYDSYTSAYSCAINKAQAGTISSATGVKGPNPLMKLPGHDRPRQSNPDGMHTIQRCLLNIHNLVTRKLENKKNTTNGFLKYGQLQLQ